jgi:DNA-directed RNA polymerase specialized sigma24 family protein
MTRGSEKRKQEYDNSLRLMLAYLCVATEAESSLIRKVEILDKFDLSDAEIARVCGRSTGSVRNARLMAKRFHAP